MTGLHWPGSDTLGPSASSAMQARPAPHHTRHHEKIRQRFDFRWQAILCAAIWGIGAVFY